MKMIGNHYNSGLVSIHRKLTTLKWWATFPLESSTQSDALEDYN